jgi:hypothetical protein
MLRLELKRERVLKKIRKIKALIKRALEYNKELILDINSLIYLLKKDFFSLVFSLLLSLIVIMP